MESNYGLDQKINGEPMMQYMATQLETIERQEVEIEKEKIKIGWIKQVNNNARLQIDAAKTDLKRLEAKNEYAMQERTI